MACCFHQQTFYTRNWTAAITDTARIACAAACRVYVMVKWMAFCPSIRHIDSSCFSIHMLLVPERSSEWAASMLWAQENQHGLVGISSMWTHFQLALQASRFQIKNMQQMRKWYEICPHHVQYLGAGWFTITQTLKMDIDITAKNPQQTRYDSVYGMLWKSCWKLRLEESVLVLTSKQLHQTTHCSEVTLSTITQHSSHKIYNTCHQSRIQDRSTALPSLLTLIIDLWLWF